MASTNLNKSGKKIRIAVSSCLQGLRVRYDGTDKNNDDIRKICEQFDCICICPESEVGLGTPRPPLNLIRINNVFKARGRTNPAFDVTEKLTRQAQNVLTRYPDICGYIFKSRSPSCGVDSTPWKSSSGEEFGVTSGIFSAEIKLLLPNLPVAEETQLSDVNNREVFVQAVLRYASKKK